MITPMYILNMLIILGIVVCAILTVTLKKTLSCIIAEAAVGVVLTTIVFVVGLKKTGGGDEK